MSVDCLLNHREMVHVVVRCSSRGVMQQCLSNGKFTSALHGKGRDSAGYHIKYVIYTIT
jgi:hypothetical protein